MISDDINEKQLKTEEEEKTEHQNVILSLFYFYTVSLVLAHRCIPVSFKNYGLPPSNNQANYIELT